MRGPGRRTDSGRTRFRSEGASHVRPDRSAHQRAKPGTRAPGRRAAWLYHGPGTRRARRHPHHLVRHQTPRPDSHQVMFAGQGAAAGEMPTHARVLCFDGPRAPEQAAAEECAGQQRIWPAIRNLSGLVGVWVLRGPQSATVVCTLAMSVPTLDTITHAVMVSELLPGEDVALLPGPDRIETLVVTACELAAGLPASTAGHSDDE